jgi:hypothetical protein
MATAATATLQADITNLVNSFKGKLPEEALKVLHADQVSHLAHPLFTPSSLSTVPSSMKWISSPCRFHYSKIRI